LTRTVNRPVFSTASAIAFERIDKEDVSVFTIIVPPIELII
jgi:hypothetical protein